jgi:magnesium chelatase family protein
VLERYRIRVSGPLLDRIDLHVHVPRVPIAQLGDDAAAGESSAAVRTRVIAARARQEARAPAVLNARLRARELRRHGMLDEKGQRLLDVACERLGLSARAFTRIVRVARTIADLAGEARIHSGHVAEAIQYRSLDRSAPR